MLFIDRLHQKSQSSSSPPAFMFTYACALQYSTICSLFVESSYVLSSLSLMNLGNLRAIPLPDSTSLMAAQQTGLNDRSAAFISQTYLGSIQTSTFLSLYFRMAGGLSTTKVFSQLYTLSSISSERPVPILQTVYKFSVSSL